ncbi:MAG: LPS export ABC transporter periplasmic protein LptC [Candidatus Eremiobacteraeota bacterium]|nr:LPS export ABC transporter periplasmic protein LptC [Candidatus Eremiobacteraeota bacterium]MBV8643970.1 LPS export ABC transporter periplasmic protein LptC [Candidatus Eremiobacteraeota bacterium]
MRSTKPAAAFGLILALAACTPNKPETAASPAPTARPVPSASATQVPLHIETHGGNGQYVTIVETNHGRKVYTIRALSGTMQRTGTNEATGDLEQPHITFVDRGGTTTIADAPKAHVAERDKTVVMTGGVHAVTSGGSVLRCDTLTYFGNTERFHGEGNVNLTAPNGLELNGRYLDGDVKLQDVNVTGNPR